MEKIIINGKEYQIDVEKCKEQGLLVEERNYPKDWNEYYEKTKRQSFNSVEECKAFIALGKLIQLRDWWWDNMCDGWRPDWSDNSYWSYIIKNLKNSIKFDNSIHYSAILAFPTVEIRHKFYEAYKDLIEEAKMFL